MLWIIGVVLALTFPAFALSQTPSPSEPIVQPEIDHAAGLARWISAFRPRALAGAAPVTKEATSAAPVRPTPSLATQKLSQHQPHQRPTRACA